jgi:hypothetical protein
MRNALVVVGRREHAERFVADQRHRARHGLPSLGMVLVDGRSPTVTDRSCQFVFNGARKLLYSAITGGHAECLGLDTGFLTAVPYGGTGLKQRSRNPFSDDVARVLTDENNLCRLQELDLNDRGLRDIWETIVATGRRCSEVVELRLDCIGRYRGLAMLWHDQTKVGNYNEGIRIPEPIYERLDARRTKTLQLFEKRFGRTPAAAEHASLALFPSRIRNPNGQQSISYGHFNQRFKTWLDSLDLGGAYSMTAPDGDHVPVSIDEYSWPWPSRRIMPLCACSARTSASSGGPETRRSCPPCTPGQGVHP